MSGRVHIVVEDREHEAFRARAAAEGCSLSTWLREAARQRLRDTAPAALGDPAALAAFFDDCDQREHGVEPDWDEHLAVIDASRQDGAPT
jgi:hypothetical protein